MDIAKKIEEPLEENQQAESIKFQKQIQDAEQFVKDMMRAGVLLRKQKFTIPLMERICTYPTD